MAGLAQVLLGQQSVSYHPIYKKLTGSIAGGILLSHLMTSFSEIESDDLQEELQKTDDMLMEETSLTIDELRAAKKKLEKLSFLQISRKGIPAKTFYTIDWDKYQDEMTSFCSEE